MTGYESKKKAASAKTIDEVNWADHEPDGRRAAQEPVVWGVDWGKAGDIPCVSIIKRLPNGGIEVMAVEYAPYSYTAPAQRTWVGLTNDEVNNFAAGCHLGKSVQGAIYEAEAKLEKNNAA